MEYISAIPRANKKASFNTFPIFIICVLSGILYSVTQSSLLGIITTVVICITIFSAEENECYIFLFGLHFLMVVIPFTIGSSVLGFVFFAYAALVFKSIINHTPIDPEAFFLIIILFVDIFVSRLNGVSKMGDNINWIGSYIYMVYIVKHHLDNIDFEKLLIFFCIAEWAICIINIIAEYKAYGKTLLPDMYGSYIGRKYVAFGTAYKLVSGGNGIAFNNAFAIALCFLQLRYTKRKAIKIFFISSIVFFTYTGFMVVSRGFYVEILLFAVLYCLSVSKNPLKLFAALLVIALLLGLFYALFYDYVTPVIEKVTERFENGNENREQLIKNSVDLLKNNIMVDLFGAGSYYPDIYKFTAHNHYYDSLLSLGIFGFLPYWIIIIRLILKTVSSHKISLGSYIPLIMLLVYKIVSGSTRDVNFYYYIAISLIYIAEYSRRKEIENAERAYNGFYAGIQPPGPDSEII